MSALSEFSPVVLAASNFRRADTCFLASSKASILRTVSRTAHTGHNPGDKPWGHYLHLDERAHVHGRLQPEFAEQHSNAAKALATQLLQMVEANGVLRGCLRLHLPFMEPTQLPPNFKDDLSSLLDQRWPSLKLVGFAVWEGSTHVLLDFDWDPEEDDAETAAQLAGEDSDEDADEAEGGACHGLPDADAPPRERLQHILQRVATALVGLVARPPDLDEDVHQQALLGGSTLELSSGAACDDPEHEAAVAAEMYAAARAGVDIPQAISTAGMPAMDIHAPPAKREQIKVVVDGAAVLLYDWSPIKRKWRMITQLPAPRQGGDLAPVDLPKPVLLSIVPRVVSLDDYGAQSPVPPTRKGQEDGVSSAPSRKPSTLDMAGGQLGQTLLKSISNSQAASASSTAASLVLEGKRPALCLKLVCHHVDLLRMRCVVRWEENGRRASLQRGRQVPQGAGPHGTAAWASQTPGCVNSQVFPNLMDLAGAQVIPTKNGKVKGIFFIPLDVSLAPQGPALLWLELYDAHNHASLLASTVVLVSPSQGARPPHFPSPTDAHSLVPAHKQQPKESLLVDASASDHLPDTAPMWLHDVVSNLRFLDKAAPAGAERGLAEQPPLLDGDLLLAATGRWLRTAWEHARNAVDAKQDQSANNGEGGDQHARNGREVQGGSPLGSQAALSRMASSGVTTGFGRRGSARTRSMPASREGRPGLPRALLSAVAQATGQSLRYGATSTAQAVLEHMESVVQGAPQGRGALQGLLLDADAASLALKSSPFTQAPSLDTTLRYVLQALHMAVEVRAPAEPMLSQVQGIDGKGLADTDAPRSWSSDRETARAGSHHGSHGAPASMGGDSQGGGAVVVSATATFGQQQEPPRAGSAGRALTASGLPPSAMRLLPVLLVPLSVKQLPAVAWLEQWLEARGAFYPWLMPFRLPYDNAVSKAPPKSRVLRTVALMRSWLSSTKLAVGEPTALHIADRAGVLGWAVWSTCCSFFRWGGPTRRAASTLRSLLQHVAVAHTCVSAAIVVFSALMLVLLGAATSPPLAFVLWAMPYLMLVCGRCVERCLRDSRPSWGGVQQYMPGINVGLWLWRCMLMVFMGMGTVMPNLSPDVAVQPHAFVCQGVQWVLLEIISEALMHAMEPVSPVCLPWLMGTDTCARLVMHLGVWVQASRLGCPRSSPSLCVMRTLAVDLLLYTARSAALVFVLHDDERRHALSPASSSMQRQESQDPAQGRTAIGHSQPQLQSPSQPQLRTRRVRGGVSAGEPDAAQGPSSTLMDRS